MINYIIGIDPGQNGSISFYNCKENKLISRKMPDTSQDILELLKTYPADECFCYLESVHSMPGQGVASSFKFGKGFGALEMGLLALQISTETLSPQKWMKALGLGTCGDRSKTEWKNHLKSKAQQLFPANKFTLATADAALICMYGIKQLNK